MTNRRDFLKWAAVSGLMYSLLPKPVRAEGLMTSVSGSRRLCRVAHITDVHILDKPSAITNFRNVLGAINKLKDKPDFIINTGDTVMDENKQTRETVQTRWNAWNESVSTSNKLMIRSCLGNHDVWYGPDETLDSEYRKDPKYGKQWAIGELKLPGRYYSFDHKGWHFVALDSINGASGYQLDDEQFEWLKQDLQRTEKDRPVLVFSHVPILSMGALLYLTRRKPIEEVRFPSGDMHNDHQKLKDLFLSHRNVKACLSGHVHYVDAVDYLGVKYLCNGAVSGNWWGDPMILDDFPPVYALIDLYEDGGVEQQLIYYNYV
jgi:3',5'-cyclic AMP phosphodiesterase CpdA